MTRALFTILTAAFFGSATELLAVPITYSLTATATGTLGASAFTNAQVTVTMTGDTSNVIPGPAPYTDVLVNYGVATVSVAGLATATFTDQIVIISPLSDAALLATLGGPGILILDNTTGTGILLQNGSVFSSYDLRSSLGPVSGAGGVASGSHTTPIFPTTAGNLTWAIGQGQPLGNSTFTASAQGAPPTNSSPQSLVVPNGNAKAAGGDSSGPLTGPFSFRFQQLLGGGQFSMGPIYITGFSWRAAPGLGPLNLTFGGSISLSTSPNSPNSNNGHTLLSKTFANNVGPDNTLVFSGAGSVSGTGCAAAGTTPCPWANDIVFTTPFYYNPAAGALLIDMSFTNFGGSGQFDVVDCRAPGCSIADVNGPLGSPTATGFDYGSNVTQITYTTSPPIQGSGQGCTFPLTPSSAGVAAAGGSGTIPVTTSEAGCSWMASSGVPWITFPSNTGTGNGTLNYTIAANTGPTSRTGTITIGGQTFTVNQGGTTCTFSLPTATQAFGPAGGSGIAAIQAPPGCSWTAVSGVSWVTITPPVSGSGDGTVAYTVAANPSTAARAGTITIANLPYTVSQSGSGSTQTCTGSVPTVPQVALEGRTEVMGDFVLNCSGLTGMLTADIALTLNTNVTNMLANGVTDATLAVSGNASPQNGLVAGYNIVHWPGVSLVPATDGTVSVRISKVRADASLVGTAGSITAQVSVSALVPVPLTAAIETVANAAPTLGFTKGQANPPTGGPQTTVPIVFQEAQAASFTANSTRLRTALTNVPTTVQVYAPVYPVEGPSKAQLYSADANGLGGSPVTGITTPGTFFGYQQLTVTAGTATATWLVLAADPTQVESWTFPLLLVNAATGDLSQIQVAGSLAPVSLVTIASPTAPVPRYRDFSVPQKLTGLRMSSSFSVAPASPAFVAAKAPQTGSGTVTVGSNVTFSNQLVNDTSDPTQSATNVVIRDNLPPGLNLVSCTVTGSASCSGTGSQVQVNYGTLAPGQSASVSVVAQVDPSLAAGTVLDNPASAVSDEANFDLFAATSSTSFIVLGGSPVVAGGTPASGSGASSNFTFQFSDPSGYQNLSVVNVLMDNVLDGRGACYLAYVVATETLVLVDDGGDAGGPYAGSVALGSSSAIQNSQCSVMLVSAVGSGATLTLMLNITFQGAFGGDRITFVAARDQGQGNTDWQPLGVWQIPSNPTGTIAVTGVTPARGAAPAGTAQQFQVALTDTKGTGDFGVVNLLVNKFIDGHQACYLAYVAASNTLILIDDAGDAGGPYAGSMPLDGGSGSIQNSQCSVSAAGSTVVSAPNTLTLTLNVTFLSAFTGNKVLYVAGRDAAGGNSTGWQAAGTWTVQ